METDFKKPVFYRAFMTAVFTGILITIASLIYDLIFVTETQFPYSSIINVSSIIFGVNIVFLLIGVIYYFFVSSNRFGSKIFVLSAILFTFLLLWIIRGVHRTDDETLNAQFRVLLGGIIIMVGIGTFVMVPVLFHNKKFEEKVL